MATLDGVNGGKVAEEVDFQPVSEWQEWFIIQNSEGRAFQVKDKQVERPWSDIAHSFLRKTYGKSDLRKEELKNVEFRYVYLDRRQLEWYEWFSSKLFHHKFTLGSDFFKLWLF